VLHPFEPRKLDVENFAVQEQQCRAREVLSSRRDIAFHRKVGQERHDLRRAHLCRMALAVKKNEASNPFNVSLLSPDTVEANALAHPVE
jgi:hypothetical protein